MSLNYIPDVISLIILAGALYALWRQRKRFQSLIPFIAGASFLMVARFFDAVIAHPRLTIHSWAGVTLQSFHQTLNYIGNLADIIGVLCLVVGFIRTIKFLQTEENKIESLEELLPICVYCKKIKNDQDEWEPVEKYLMDFGAPPLTHGFCSECASKMHQELNLLFPDKKEK